MSGMRRYFFFASCAATLVASGCGGDDDPPPPPPPDAGAPVCGNGIVEGTETCDDGNPRSGDGCEADCTFSCDENADCGDGNDCNGTETCHPTLHRCQAGTPLGDGFSCTYYVPAPVPDGGVGSGWVAAEDPGVCISQACGKPCVDAADCDDGNVCNGVETCGDGIYPNNCAPGPAPNCDDGLDCTVDSCDAVTGCANELIDGDGDTFADASFACDARGGDCDDADDTVYPGAQELCSDGKDNDCDGLADAADPQQPTWYQDCDGDDFARADAESATQCEMPGTSAQCASWTTRTPVGVDNIDCDDTLDLAHPGADFFNRPYCKGGGAQATGSVGSFSCASSGGSLSWDYNCVNGTEYFSTYVNNTCGGGFLGCYTSGGWTGGSYPGCAYTAQWSDCYSYCNGLYSCFPLGCAVDSTYDRQQTCR